MKGEGKGPTRLVIASRTSSVKMSSTHQKGNGSADKFRGVNMEGTSLTSMDGRMAPAWFTLKVTANELPRDMCPEGIIVIKVPGLCIGGSVDAFADQVGCICIARDYDKIDEVICWEHWERVHAPFLKKT